VGEQENFARRPFELMPESRSRKRPRLRAAVCCDDNGMPSFDRIRYRRHDASVFLYAFDLIELSGVNRSIQGRPRWHRC